MTGERAGKEYSIECSLRSMKEIWEGKEGGPGINFQVLVYKSTFIIRGYDEIQTILDEHIVNTQAMLFSPF